MAERIFEIASCRSVTHGVAWLKRSYQTLLRRAGCSRVSCPRARSSDPSCWISCSRKPLALINPQLSRSAIHMASFMSRLAAGNVLDGRRIGHWPASVRTCRRSAYSTPTSNRPRSFHRHMGTQYTRSPLATGMIRAQETIVSLCTSRPATRSCIASIVFPCTPALPPWGPRTDEL
jgi:hypothetical protein